MTETAYISYEEFGRRFFEMAVTEERIGAAIGNLAGQPIDFGPIGVGPGRVAKVSATGSIGEPRSDSVSGDGIVFRFVLPVHLAFEVNLQLDTHRFQADLEVPLVLTARAAVPLFVVIDAEQPKASDIGVTLKAEGLRASVLSKAVGVEGELKRFVAKYVGRELNKASILKARTIDVGAAINASFATMYSGSRDDESDTVTSDLATALEQEIAANPQLIDGSDE